ncbi:hypothetical protein ABEH33_07165 [Pantoea agglomerans]|uniref:hypothetical protein n=1 Tax=Enterobacter agglomerans TaxID=549 RepID=UPI00320BA52D
MIGKIKLPIKPSAKIVKVERIDENGNSHMPPTYEYWVIIDSSPPVVKSVANSFNEALANLISYGYRFTP